MIARWEGFLFLGSYMAYTVFLIFMATSNPALESFQTALLVVLPLIVATLIWTSTQFFRQQQRRKIIGEADESIVH
jgi:cation:H+ antiporter